MLRSAWIAVGALLASGAAGRAQQAEPKEAWQEFRSVEGNFLLWVPATPEEIKVKGCPPGAQVWQASGATLALFQFGYIGRQKAADDKEIDALLDGLAAESAESLKGSVDTVKKITLSGWPGREARIRFAAGEVPMVLLDRIFLVRDVKLFVRVMVPESESAQPSYRKILDSFKLIDESRVSRR
jgi:hypothetical protein